ncbi:DUF4439 domain-containing protein [Arthrobacter sp. H14-L1]|uniref:DUF4439 domain-containing protein n=1 Tax=Arthrobacter sp. H14-L1 TaxID=2996697 RepID=UPI00226E712D|nr:DUF4439 domain-containing protein [Arthrobacter sp. H14-L1]
MTDSRSRADGAADDDSRPPGATSSGITHGTGPNGPRRAADPSGPLAGPAGGTSSAVAAATGPETAAAYVRDAEPSAGVAAQLSAPVETKLTPSPAPETALQTTGGTLRRLLLLLLTGTVVLGMGTAIVSVKAVGPAGPSTSERARVDELHRVTALAGSAATLEAAAGVPAVALQLRSARTMLDVYAAALSVPGDVATDSATAATSSMEQTSRTQPGPAGIPELILGLTASSTASLTAARTAPGGLARVLAAGGAAALMQARALAADVGNTVPESPYLAASGSRGPAGTGGANGTSPKPGASPTAVPVAAPTPAPCATQRTAPAGVNDDQALLAAVEAEHKAVYAYQVAATRLANPTSSLAVRILSDHESTLSSLQDLLTARCLALPALQPGYELAPGFTATPAAALATLEDQLAIVYAQLLALSEPADGGSAAVVRTTALMALVHNAQHRWSWGQPEVPLPGIDRPAAVGPVDFRKSPK